MNSWTWIILALMGIEFSLETVADLLNLKNANVNLPSEFEGVYDRDSYKKSQEYLRENTRFSLTRRSVSLFTFTAFLLLGGFAWTDGIARSFGHGPVLSGLIFAGVLSLLRAIVSLPFSLYGNFVIEAKYGFNRMTVGTFVGDSIKGLALGALLGGLVFAGLIYFFENAGPFAWLYSWGALTAFQLAMTFLAPVILLPLFNEFKPIPEGSLKTRIFDYISHQRFQMNGVYTMDGSRRSTKSNAFFTGFGKFRRLVLFDTLLEKHSEDELLAVLAHEIGHYRRRHILKSTVISILISALLLWTLGLVIRSPGITRGFGVSEMSVYASLVFAGILYSPILRVFSIFAQVLSRRFEFEADEFSVRTFGKPEALVSALKKLSIDHLSNLTPHPLKVLLDYSHPPVLQRLQRIESIASAP